MSTEIKKDAPNETAILAKANKGEKLTDAEEEFVAGLPNAERSPEPAPAEDDKDKEPGAEDPSAPPKEADEDKEPEDLEKDVETEDPKPAGAEAEKTPEEEAKARRALINAELEKPDAETDLSQFTPTEIGLYFDLKKERRRRQKAEAKSRELEFKELAKTLKEELQPEKKAEEEEDPLAGRDDDDVVSVADVKKLLAKTKKAEPVPAKPIITADQMKTQTVQAKAALEAKGLKDFDEVGAYAEWALQGDEDARDILIETAKSGGNIMEKTYWLVKGSPRWPKIAEAIRKAKPNKDNEDRARRIEKNGEKVRTLGSAAGTGAQPGTISREKVAAMSINDFKNLSPKEQEWILRNYGSDPNH